MFISLEEAVSEKKRVLISVKIEADVYRLVKTAASWKGMDIAQYLSVIIRPVATRDCARIGKDVGKVEKEDSDE